MQKLKNEHMSPSLFPDSGIIIIYLNPKSA